MTKNNILISRNQREGGYIGWRKLGPMKRGRDWLDADGNLKRQKPGHQRVGKELMVSTLRQGAMSRL